MSRPSLLAVCLIAMGLPSLASAQTVSNIDRAYCDKLIALFVRYVDYNDPGRTDGGSDLEGRVAIARCQQGDTASGIPVLERKLRNNGFTLPKRD